MSLWHERSTCGDLTGYLIIDPCKYMCKWNIYKYKYANDHTVRAPRKTMVVEPNSWSTLRSCRNGCRPMHESVAPSLADLRFHNPLRSSPEQVKNQLEKEQSGWKINPGNEIKEAVPQAKSIDSPNCLDSSLTLTASFQRRGLESGKLWLTSDYASFCWRDLSKTTVIIEK